MSTTKRLGLYWGDTGINLVELNHDAPVLCAKVSFADLENNPVIGIKSLTEDLRLLDVVQKTIRNKGFSTVDSYLSLPSKDIIIRWFLIPWMKPSEIEGVVSFEARKYLPFALEELVYTYYPSTISKGNTRQIGVIFVAIRKVTLEKYVNVLTQAGLNVACSEPASMSLIRALVMRRIMEVDKVTAVLNVHEDSGEILIASQGFVKFTRDFKMHAATEQQSPDGQNVTKAKFFNEVKISLEFFSRQHVDEEVQKIIVLSSGLHHDIWAGLEEELALPVKACDVASVIDNAETPETGFINAFGAALSGSVPVVVDFNLSEGQGQLAKIATSVPGAMPSTKIFMAGAVAIFCVAVLAGTFFLTGKRIEEKEAQKQAVVSRLGSFSSMDLSEVTSKTDAEKKKIEAVKSLPFQRPTAPLIIHLVQLLPKGVWLEQVSVEFSEKPATSRGVPKDAVDQAGDGSSSKKKVALKAEYFQVLTSSKLNISGFAFTENANEEFDMVNQFLDQLKSDAEFSDHFGDIKLSAIRSVDMDGRQVASFSIRCE